LLDVTDVRAQAVRAGVDVPIETKFHVPSPRKEWVDRRELVQNLAGAAVKLILVDAPAGFGKTTLVAQWLSSTAGERSFAWISLDRGDDDPGRLWWHIVCALQRACPELGVEEILKELRFQTPDVTETVLPILVNELAALSAPVVLVLDDYHMIKERTCHDQIAFLLLHLPASAQIVLITRSDPPLPVARLRAVGQLAEIRARELRFAPEQAAALVYAVSAVQLSEPDLADLTRRTEGWPAGLYLAALSLRGNPTPSAFIRQFTGDNRFIVDFLAEEVLSRQPSQIRQFLARTAILSRFCAQLCDAVTGSANDSAQIIDVLERDNLFIVPLDDNRQWFRYHHLFAQVLRSQLARTEPDILPALHERASAWHREWGSADEAIGHALNADDVAGAVDLMARHWVSYVDVGRAATVGGWMRSLGDDQIAANPLAAHCAAWAAAVSGERETAVRWLPVFEAEQHEGPLPDGMLSLQSSAALLRGVFGFEGLRVMRESAGVAAELESDPTSPWYALARAALGFSLYLSGEPEAAAGPLEEAVQNETSFSLVRLLALSSRSLVAVALGRLPEAQELASAARGLATRGDLSNMSSSSLAYTANGAVYAAEGRLEEARSELEHAVRFRRRMLGVSPWATVEATLVLTQVLLDLGDRAGAAELAGEARDLLTALPDGAEALRARLERLEGRVAGRSRLVSFAEPLTQREAAVLRLLRGTLSVREIGHELYLSQNTIKTHTQAIYRKLGVSTRLDAVAKGHDTGIL
jgi:LuxR family transcriptional regulator, maltose regulon positive regulatory protein